MKRIKQQSATGQIASHKTSLRILCKALMAAELLSAFPLFAGSLPTLPTTCAGVCGSSGNLSFVQAGSATTSTNGAVMTINQTTPTAILNWQNFNIANGNTVNFVQPSSTARALNKIWDSNPSTIAGSLNANGQIYLINQNGIIFANGSQVNVQTLVASSLGISDSLFQAGYLTNTQLVPSFSGTGGFIRVDTGAQLNGSTIMLFAPVVENNGNIATADGQVVLAAGHNVYLEASQDPNLRGVLVEVDVNNPGQADPALAATSSQPAQVQINQAGTVSNFGSILSQRGNATLVGYAVNQQGRISATTSVNENGTIKLEARYNVENGVLLGSDPNNPTMTLNQSALANGETVFDIRATQTGQVTLGRGSMTQVMPDPTTAQSTTTDSLSIIKPIGSPEFTEWLQRQLGFNPSIIEAMGNTINMQSGSSIIAPGGKVTLAAISSYSYDSVTGTGTGLNPATPPTVGVSGNNPYQEISSGLGYSSFLNPNYKPSTATSPATTDTARVFLDSGSTIDVSGSQASVSVARDILSVQLRGAELANAPLQTNGFLWGQNVNIDIRQGSTLANYSGEEAQIGRTVAERTASGGIVLLTSTGDVLMKSSVTSTDPVTGVTTTTPAATINLSGGQVDYTGAYINTTTLTSNGINYNIATASPNILYDGVTTGGTYTVANNKWGVSQTYNTLSGGVWDPGYIEGKSAGTLTVLAPDAVLNGSIAANTVSGINQRLPYIDPSTLAVNNYKSTYQMLPQGGMLVIGDSNPAALIGVLNYINNSNVNIQTGSTQSPLQVLPSNFTLFDASNNVTALPSSLQQTITLDANVLGSTTGLERLAVYSNGTISVPAGTAIQLTGEGSITLKGNSVDVTGSINAPSGSVNLSTAFTTESIGNVPGGLNIGTIGTVAQISTSGQWVNDVPQMSPPDLSTPVLINGGKITLSSGGDLQVAAGTVLDASGGGWIDSANKLHGGNGGTILLASGNNGANQPFKAQLDGVNLGSFGVAGGKGGALTIKAGDIELGPVAGSSGNGVLDLPGTFFQSGGFSSYNITAQGLTGLTVDTGAVIAPETLTLNLNSAASTQTSGSSISTFTTPGFLPNWQRVPASITLGQSNGNSGNLKVDTGAQILVDPTASITLNATNQLTVLGMLNAPAGTISLNLNPPGTANYNPGQSIWIGSQSQLLSLGYFFESQPNAQNLVSGQVLSGGKININANNGFVVAQNGSVMDVSGTSANIDLPQLESGEVHYQLSNVAGNAGSISIQTVEGGFLDGSMKAGLKLSNASVAGGTTVTVANTANLAVGETISGDGFAPGTAIASITNGTTFVTSVADSNINATGITFQVESKAAAGTFSLALNNYNGVNSTPTDPTNPLNPAQIQAMATPNGGFASIVGLTQGSDAGAGQTSLNVVAGQFFLDPGALQQSGFDQVVLKSDHAIVLAANLQTRIGVTLDTPQLVVNGTSTISSAHVTIGNLNSNNQALVDPASNTLLSPAAGKGTLDVTGQLVDLTGNFLVSGTNQINITSSGDIRLNGVVNSNGTSLTGGLSSQANISLQANQIYPTTLAQFTLAVEDGAGNPAGNITILPGQQSASPVMSAGGQLTLSTANIVQDGVVQAPLGVLNLTGSQSVILGAGSLTSVSANGQTIPYGLIQGNNTWVYDLTGSGSNLLPVSAPPQKKVSLIAPNVAIQSGATVDISGGGDLYAYQFVAATSGSVNLLNPAQASVNTFAILPGVSGYAPYDPQYSGLYAQSGSKTSLTSGESVYLSGGNGISAGYYALLPASYALLPGAYLITAVSGYTDMLPGLGSIKLTGGSQIIAGKFAMAGTGIQDARFSGFEVTPATVALTQSEYPISYANPFFAAQATTSSKLTPPLPVDAGVLVVSAVGTVTLSNAIVAGGTTVTVGSTANLAVGEPISGDGFPSGTTIASIINGTNFVTSAADTNANASSVTLQAGANLTLDGAIKSQPGAGGNGSMVDLNGPGFDIVNTITTGAANGLVQLTTDTLNNLGANSLLIGGVRTLGTSGMSIAVGAGQVVVDNSGGNALSAPEIILAANNAVTVNAGSVVEGQGTFSGQVSNITIGSATGANGDGALLRVSTAPQVTVTRNNRSGTATPALTVENGATVGGAQNSVLLDSSYTTSVGNTAVLNGLSLSVAAQNIDIGNPSPAASSFEPSGTLLAELNGTSLTQTPTFKDLTLHSYNDINFYGAVSLGGVDAKQQHILGNLVLNGLSLNGLNNQGQTNIIDAATVTLMNNNNGSPVSTPYGAGNLQINANQIVLANGSMAVQGFDSVTFAAAQQILGQGTSSVKIVSGDSAIHNLVLQAGQISAASNSNLTITAPNEVISIQTVSGASGTVANTLGAKLAITGNSITDNGLIDLPTGSITLHATGLSSTDGVTLGNGSNIAAAGVAETIAGQTVYTPAGTINLTADNGGVDILSGTTLNVSGATGGGNAGSINISAPNSTVSIAGILQGTASTNNKQGSFTVDANTLVDANPKIDAGNALTGINDILTEGGFTYLRDIRIRSGDLVVAADAGTTTRAQANTFKLEADAGNIDVQGTINSSGASGGNIQLIAQNNVTLDTGAELDAHATGAGLAGGQVTIETSKGQINLNNQPINVLGGVSGNSGSVLLRAPRINSNTDVALYNTGGTSLNVSANADVTVEAFQTYAAPTNGIFTTSNVGPTSVYYSDATAFSSNATTIMNRLGMSLTSTTMNLVPGVEIDSTGDLTLAANWDLSGWRFNNGSGQLSKPGILTLRAAGNLFIGSGTTPASLTDGVSSANDSLTIKENGLTPPNFTLTTTPSWSYRLVSGADLTSSDLMAVNNTVSTNSGNLVLLAGSENTTGTGATAKTVYNMEQIRTGTGFIDIAAGGNFTLGNRDSVIYTTGQLASNIPTGVSGANRDFGINGGDITILADGNINGAPTNQLITDWLWRQGSTDGTLAVIPAWWVNLATFRQNIGALGGGNLSVFAGGDINNLSAVVPSTGYLNMADPANPATALVSGGSLNVTAGGDINSGVFYVGNGQGLIQAGGSLGASRYTPQNIPLYTILALGNGNIDVNTGGDLNLQTVLNPTVLSQGYSQNPLIGATDTYTYFFTYGNATGVSLSSLNGNVMLSNTVNLSPTSSIYYNNASSAASGFFYLNDSGATLVYPGTLRATALGGNINSNDSSTPILYPSASGNLQLIASGNIQLSGSMVMSDAAPSSSGLQASSPASSFSIISPGLMSGLKSIHAQDTQPVIVSAGGSIIGDNSVSVTPNLELPKAAQVQAGLDVQNLSLNVQNLNSTDTTSIVAGRDIVFTPNPANPSDTTLGIAVSGPGQVVLQAGRNVDLGQSNGVVTTGNLANPFLPQQGAGVTVLAGVSQGIATESFINQYINPANVTAYVNKFLDPNTTLWTSADIVNYLNPNTATGLSMMPSLIPYVASKGASAANAFNIYMAKPSDQQSNFMLGNADLISYVASNGAPKGLTNAQAFAYFNTMSTEKQSLFITSEQALANFKALSFADQLSFITGGAEAGLISFVANNGGPQGSSVTVAQAFDYFKTLSTNKQSLFISGGADLISFVASNGGPQGSSVTAAQAFNYFETLPLDKQNLFVDQVLFAQLQQSGSTAASSGNYSAGYASLATLFPSEGYQGDLSLYYSQIKTERGGDINILTPGGGVNAGLANPPLSAPPKTAAQLGVVTVDGGSVNAIVNTDFTVNQSRVFTLQGGNILMWSSIGNLDAGKGSKTVSSTPPPQLVVDPKTGTFTVDVTQSVVGSGIRVLLANQNVVPGSVYLFAPTGVINAGDAGIGAAGNIILGGTVLNGGNINFGGTSIGVPVTAVAPVSVSGMGSMQDAGKAADQATQSLNNANDLSKIQEALANFKPTFISVDVIGLGDESIGLQQ